VETAELYTATRRLKNFPWRCTGEVPPAPYIFSIVLRLALGAAAALVFAYGGRLSPLGAVVAGIAAPTLLEQLGRYAPKTTLHSLTMPVPLPPPPEPLDDESSTDEPG
jgi:hypothetical protein